MIKQAMELGYFDATVMNLTYFEPGHTFMSADSAHSRIERSLVRKDGKVFDFNDLKSAFCDAGCEIGDMSINDFALWQSNVSQYSLGKMGDNRPYIA